MTTASIIAGAPDAADAGNAVPERKVFCLLGLPFDALSMADAEQTLRRHTGSGTSRILSTPNLNWVATAARDTAFRQSVLASTCSVVDGMPLVWLARLLGLPCRERVSGSDLVERLQGSPQHLRVYFLGGLGDVAARATEALQRAEGGLVPVGSCNPGKGSVKEMSRPEIIAAINAAAPDLLVVSLGAMKGQGWIMHNLRSLNVPWISHLGAVVNFFAGEVRRAPPWVASAGLEWVWRILQEPMLWRRYWADGQTVLYLLCFRLIPYGLLAWCSRSAESAPGKHLVQSRADGSIELRLLGNWGDAASQDLGRVLNSEALSGRNTCVNLSDITRLGNMTIAQLCVARGRAALDGSTLHCVTPSQTARWSLMAHCAEFLLEP